MSCGNPKSWTASSTFWYKLTYPGHVFHVKKQPIRQHITLKHQIVLATSTGGKKLRSDASARRKGRCKTSKDSQDWIKARNRETKGIGIITAPLKSTCFYMLTSVSATADFSDKLLLYCLLKWRFPSANHLFPPLPPNMFHPYIPDQRNLQSAGLQLRQYSIT